MRGGRSQWGVRGVCPAVQRAVRRGVGRTWASALAMLSCTMAWYFPSGSRRGMTSRSTTASARAGDILPMNSAASSSFCALHALSSHAGLQAPTPCSMLHTQPHGVQLQLQAQAGIAMWATITTQLP